ncbi:hypothetical protein ACFX2I_009146 [Malus domestica]
MMELEGNDNFDQIVFDPEAFSIVQSMDLDFNPSTFFDDVDLDDQLVAVAVTDLPVFDRKKKKIYKPETVLSVTVAPPLPSSRPQNPNPNQASSKPHTRPDIDWNDARKMESSTLKLRQSYQHQQRNRRKIQILPPPELPKPQPTMQNKGKALPSFGKGKVLEIVLQSLYPLASPAQNPNKETPLSSSMINPRKETPKPDVDWNDAQKMESRSRACQITGFKWKHTCFTLINSNCDAKRMIILQAMPRCICGQILVCNQMVLCGQWKDRSKVFSFRGAQTGFVSVKVPASSSVQGVINDRGVLPPRARRSAISDYYLVYNHEVEMNEGMTDDPATYQEAMDNSQSDKWLEAMDIHVNKSRMSFSSYTKHFAPVYSMEEEEEEELLVRWEEWD